MILVPVLVIHSESCVGVGVRQYRNHIVAWCDIEYEEEAGQTERRSCAPCPAARAWTALPAEPDRRPDQEPEPDRGWEPDEEPAQPPVQEPKEEPAPPPDREHAEAREPPS